MERLRFMGLGLGCLLPLPLILIVQLGITLMSEARGSVAGYMEISLVLVETAIIAAQVVTLTGLARSSIVGDHVHLSGLARARRIMTFLSFPVLALAVVLLFVQVALMGALGFVFNVLLFAVGVLGLTGWYVLRRLERMATHGGYGGHGGHGPAPWQPPVPPQW